MRLFFLLFTLFILCLTPMALAQNDCPAIIANALENVDAVCKDITRNQLCYGNLTLEVILREGAADFQFSQTGDVASLIDVETLRLSSFNPSTTEWGVALMKVQANLPDTLPGQNVTFLLFGDVAMTNAGDQMGELRVTARRGVNVRQRPGTSAGVIGSLSNGQEVIALRRLPDSSWILVRLDDATTGWVSADFLNGDLERLLAANPDALSYGPMQAFYFKSGVGDSACAEAPESGILIQTPEGAGTIELNANNVQIRLGSTVYLQAVPGDAMFVNVLEGQAFLTAEGESQLVPAGTVASVPLDADGVASGPPEFPETYNRDMLEALPLNTALPQAITVQPGLTRSRISGAIDIANGLPPSGPWTVEETVINTHCEPGAPQVGSANIWRTNIDFNEDRSSFTLPAPSTVNMFRIGDNRYRGTFSISAWEVTFTSPTTFTGMWINGRRSDPCTLITELAGEYGP